MTITTVTEGRRGCGYRKEGGLYLRTDGIGRYCGALPIPLTVCPTCHHGIKPTRGWTWINLAELVAANPITCVNDCGDCPIADARIQEVGLLWIGAQYYKSPADFDQEARTMGLSRRITAIPNRFVLGETWVALAHRCAIRKFVKGEVDHEVLGKTTLVQEQFTPAIFHVFKPARIEYVVAWDDPDKKLEALEKRGITLVKVVRKEAK